jgi:hypothetical protein
MMPMTNNELSLIWAIIVRLIGGKVARVLRWVITVLLASGMKRMAMGTAIAPQ